MKKFIVFLFCSIVFGFTATVFGADPNTTLPPLKIVQCTLPPRACDCQPCVCPPGTCECPGCANGCKKSGASAAQMDAIYSVGSVDGVSTLPVQSYTAPVQYQQQCVNGVCRLVPVTIPQAKPAVQAGSVCPCCGMVMNAEQAAKVQASPVQYAAPMQTYAAPVTYSCGAGACADWSCSMASAGDDSASMTRGQTRRAARRARRGTGRCGG